MKIPKRPWLLAVLASLVALGAAAIEPPAQQAPAKPAPAESTPPDAGAPADAKSKDDATPAADEVDEELPPLPPDTVPAGPPPARFDPSEKVRADFPVSFPIDT